jgi:hypothetical protein
MPQRWNCLTERTLMTRRRIRTNWCEKLLSVYFSTLKKKAVCGFKHGIEAVGLLLALLPALADGRAPLPLGILGLLLPLCQDLSVFCGCLAVHLAAPPLDGQAVPLPLQHLWCHQPLDLGGLEALQETFTTLNAVVIKQLTPHYSRSLDKLS